MQPHTPATSTPNSARHVKAYLDRHRAELVAMLGRDGQAGVALARRHSKIIDGLLTALYPMAFGSEGAQTLHGSREAHAALCAVGGYGRELLALKSDLDVRLVTVGSAEPMQSLAEALLYPLWDAGVSIGHQVVSIADAVCAAESDLPTATALLDLRSIAGDPSTSAELRARAYAGPFSPACVGRFLLRLQDEVSERHRRFSDSTYLLEPDVKSGPGGLRDLDVALWAARARFRSAHLGDLTRAGVLLAREAHETLAAAEFLWALRNHLHHHAGRRSDRLTFDEQERIALAMGYQARLLPDADPRDERAIALMVEAFMSDYHRHARVVTRMQAQLLARATPRIQRGARRNQSVGLGLCSDGAELSLADPEQLRRDPSLAFRLYVAAVARNESVLPATREQVARSAADPAFGTALRASSEAAALFVELAGSLRRTQFRHGSILAELHDVNLLSAMIPEFLGVVGRVHHDLYHVYPVDVHSIAAVDHLRALIRGDLAHEAPFASGVAACIDRPELLLLATLLHDVGKTIGGRDHARRGAELTREVLGRLGLDPVRIERGQRLVTQHMQMAFVATRRDLGEARIVLDFAHTLQDRDMLRELYLLTLADLATTAPNALTDWKARMLEELYLAADAMLSSMAASTTARLTAMRERVVQLWGLEEDPAFLQQFLLGMPPRYLLAYAPGEIAAHARVASSLRTGGPPVTARLVPSRHPGVAELCIVASPPAPSTEPTAPMGTGLCVVTDDRPGLLAAITAAIVASRLEIHAAQIHSRRLGDGSMQAVDLFWVRDRAEGAAGVERALPKLQRDLEQVLAGRVSVDQLGTQPAPSRWSERPSPRVATEVSVDGHTSTEHTIIEVITKDRPGLLFKLARLMRDLGLTIATAKIHTEGNRVVDVFYVTEPDGTKLAPGRRTDSVRDRIEAALA